jgi:hypothetical protein
MLCEQCNNPIAGHWVESWRNELYGHSVAEEYLNGYYHHDTLRDLRECAEGGGCRICQLVARESRTVDEQRAALPLLFNLRAMAPVLLYTPTIIFQIVEQGIGHSPIASVGIFPQYRMSVLPSRGVLTLWTR